MSVNKVSMNTLIVQIDDMINQRKCECTQENKRESLVYVSCDYGVRLHVC